MTKWKYYDLLVKTSAEGGFPSHDLANCRYRDLNGRRCAIGLLIPDDRYQSTIEGCSVYLLGIHHTNLLQDITPEGVFREDLEAIQKIHDFRVGEWVVDGDDESEWVDKPWDHTAFVAGLDALPCFSRCARPLEEPTG